MAIQSAVLLLVALAAYPRSVRGDCECGYSVNSTTDDAYQVFTDVIESNFLTIQNISVDTDWQIQRYWAAPKPGADYGRNCTDGNLISNPLVHNASLVGPGQLGGTPGLQIWVRGGLNPLNNLVPSGEIRTARDDMLYGTIRTAVQLTPVNGTCSAIFSYFNDVQEVDIELLSHEYANPTGPPASPINLVLHSQKAQEAGFQTPNTTDYGAPVLPVLLTDSFHEFRFDWLPGHVSFYFDGSWLWDLEGRHVPSKPSAMFLSHWSNGAPGWSQGPPTHDAVMTVSYFKAYFNTTNPARLKDYELRCLDPTREGAICVIPDQIGAPNGTNAGTSFFYTQQNKTVNQTIYALETNATYRLLPRYNIWALVAAIAVTELMVYG